MGLFGKNLFGGLFDFNRDGKTSCDEEWLAYKIFEECTKKDEDTNTFGSSSTASERYDWRDTCEDGIEFGIDPEDYETEEDYEEALEEAKYDWRDTCEDGIEFGINPEDYETNEDYKEALEKAKYDWRDTCEDGIEFGIDPGDYETNEDYKEALEEAKYDWRDTCDDGLELGIDPEDYETEEDYEEALEEARKNFDFPNKRRYNAADTIENYYFLNEEYEQHIKACCKFIVEKADTILAANYLTQEGDFLYAQAVKDHFTLPAHLPDEDETRKYEFSQMIGKIARKNIPLSLEVWAWCLEQFLPYALYDEYAVNDMTNAVIDELYHFPKTYRTKLAHYMDEHSKFRKTVMSASNEPARDLPELIAEAIAENLLPLAKTLFKDGLKQAGGQWKAINQLTSDVISQCRNYDELESIEYLERELLPLVKTIDDGMVQDEIEEWEKEISEYIEYVEQNCEKYAYTHRNAWRKTVPAGKKYGLNPRYYDTEQKYLEALEQEKERAKQQKQIAAERAEQLKKAQDRAFDPAILEDKTIYIYCSVSFSHASPAYSFRTDDTTIKIGDTVIVPIGDKQEEKEGTVVSVGQYTRMAAPYPVEKTKFILRKHHNVKGIES